MAWWLADVGATNGAMLPWALDRLDTTCLT